MEEYCIIHPSFLTDYQERDIRYLYQHYLLAIDTCNKRKIDSKISTSTESKIHNMQCDCTIIFYQGKCAALEEIFGKEFLTNNPPEWENAFKERYKETHNEL